MRNPETPNNQKEVLPIAKIQKIALEVMGGYENKEIPQIEDIQWAFPVNGPDRTHYVRNGYLNVIPNTQEGNAFRQIMMLRNFSNILKLLSNGKTLRYGIIPNHRLPIENSEDMAYLQNDYTIILPDNIKEKRFPNQNLKKPTSFFHDNIPEELIKAVLNTCSAGWCQINRDEWGFGKQDKTIKNVYQDSDLTKEYLTLMRQSLELGYDYLLKCKSLNKSKTKYPQLVVGQDIENWKKEDVFEMAFYRKNEGGSPTPNLQVGKVSENLGDKFNLFFTTCNKYFNKNVAEIFHEIKNFPTETMNSLAKNKMLWKLILPK